MSASQYDEFDRRVRRISRRQTRLSHGYVTTITDDGMIVAKPKRKGNGATLRALLLLLLIMVVFKAVLHSRLGAEDYQARIDALAAGSIVERAGAFVMAADPITALISGQISSLVR